MQSTTSAHFLSLDDDDGLVSRLQTTRFVPIAKRKCVPPQVFKNDDANTQRQSFGKSRARTRSQSNLAMLIGRKMDERERQERAKAPEREIERRCAQLRGEDVRAPQFWAARR